MASLIVMADAWQFRGIFVAEQWQEWHIRGRFMAAMADSWQIHGSNGRFVADSWQKWQIHGWCAGVTWNFALARIDI